MSRLLAQPSGRYHPDVPRNKSKCWSRTIHSIGRGATALCGAMQEERSRRSGRENPHRQLSRINIVPVVTALWVTNAFALGVRCASESQHYRHAKRCRSNGGTKYTRCDGINGLGHREASQGSAESRLEVESEGHFKVSIIHCERRRCDSISTAGSA